VIPERPARRPDSTARSVSNTANRSSEIGAPTEPHRRRRPPDSPARILDSQRPERVRVRPKQRTRYLLRCEGSDGDGQRSRYVSLLHDLDLSGFVGGRVAVVGQAEGEMGVGGGFDERGRQFWVHDLSGSCTR
jgi:hypothetical protein